MSSYIVNKIDIIDKKNPNSGIDIYQKNIEKILKNKKNINKLKQNILQDLNPKSNSIHDNKINLKNSSISKDEYQNSLILLKMIENQAEKTIFEKYEIDNNSSLEKNEKKIIHDTINEVIKNILVKKNF